jgi:hypothetical protein
MTSATSPSAASDARPARTAACRRRLTGGPSNHDAAAKTAAPSSDAVSGAQVAKRSGASSAIAGTT